MSQVTVRMRKVICTFKALIHKRLCKPLNSNNNVFTLIYLLIEIPCLRLFVTQHSMLVWGLLKLWVSLLVIKMYPLGETAQS